MLVFDLRLKADQKNGHQLGHRVIAPGETLIRGQAKSADDLRFFANHLRWSAFEVIAVSDETVKSSEVATVQEEKPKRGRSRPVDLQPTV